MPNSTHAKPLSGICLDICHKLLMSPSYPVPISLIISKPRFSLLSSLSTLHPSASFSRLPPLLFLFTAYSLIGQVVVLLLGHRVLGPEATHFMYLTLAAIAFL
ncbi:uncharacterized protein EI97DRAFT_100211 [Westerdykella ornata]|uniref:Uncharacterized protein n=1 Tax=Westerdykella ornata TaxID=318751 RepID=A0A6A6JEQ9_WESOR|nr:uncharacterized protein EI97DRAFT_100211 [Westerdykella ornata]KAF2274468.1 hypothetical protein EI97DRAFT_100211 [Westerdykella ornata]